MLLFLLLYGVVELASFVLYAVHYGSMFSFSALQQRKEKQRASVEVTEDEAASLDQGLGGRIGRRVVHPYLGYVYQPGTETGDLSREQQFEGCPVNEHGFIGQGAFAKRSADELNVLFVGGSFAHQLFCMSKSRLANKISSSPRFSKRKVKLYALTTGGYKQPQQVIAANYYLSIGGKVDILINIDGFNEVHGDRLIRRSRTFPAYPDNWELFFIDRSQKKQLVTIGRIQLYRELAAHSADLSRKVRFSVTAGLLWSLFNDLLTHRIRQGNQKLKTMQAKSLKYRFDRDGPRVNIPDLATFSAEVWYRSSVQLAAMAKQRGIAYYHFLQPNQYIHHSKKFSTVERKNFLKMSAEEKKVLNHRYGLLRRQAKQLRKHHVAFFDLSYLFKAEESTIYADACCHVNQKGNDLIMDLIGEKITADQRTGTGPDE